MLTDRQKEQLRGLNGFKNESRGITPTYFDFEEQLDDQGIPLFRSEQDIDTGDGYIVGVTLEDYPESILIYYQYFTDGYISGIEYADLADIPEEFHQYLITSQEEMRANIFGALSDLHFDSRENSRGDWRAICVLQGV